MIKTEEKAKVIIAVVWGTYFNAVLTIWQQGRFGKKILEEHPFGRVLVWYDVNRILIHFSKAIIPPSIAIILFILFFKIILVQNSQRGMELNDSIPQIAVTTFAFSSVFILLLW